MVSKQVVKKIKEYSIYQDWYVSFDGKSKGNRHLFRVAKIALFLATLEGANLNMVEAGAWLHDIGLTQGNDNNPKKIAKIARDFLNTLDISNADKNIIAGCVAAHEGMVEAKTLEAKIVHDGDVLDKMGILGVIRHTWKLTNLISPKASAEENFDTLKEHLNWRKHKLYTKTAIHLMKKLDNSLQKFFKNRKQSVEVVREIMKYAKKGVTTEKIANKILADKKLSIVNDLDEQLSCHYLSKQAPRILEVV